MKNLAKDFTKDWFLLDLKPQKYFLPVSIFFQPQKSIYAIFNKIYLQKSNSTKFSNTALGLQGRVSQVRFKAPYIYLENCGTISTNINTTLFKNIGWGKKKCEINPCRVPWGFDVCLQPSGNTTCSNYTHTFLVPPKTKFPYQPKTP